MQLYFLVNVYQLGTESDKVLAALTYLEGAVIEWFKPYIYVWFRETEDKQDNNITKVFMDYSKFVYLIMITFGEVDEKVLAAQKVR
jgi:hypothetical protein